MRRYRQDFYPNLIRTGYELRTFLPILYFTICYTSLVLLPTTAQLVLATLLGITGIGLLVFYVTKSQSDISSNNWRSIHAFGILSMVSLTTVLVLYATGTAFIPFGSALLSTIGFTAASKDVTTFKKILVYLYPDGTKVHDVSYPPLLQFLYAITHSKREYGDLDANQKIDNILLSVSTEHEIGFITFNSNEDYINWLDDSEKIMACERCYRDEECAGSTVEVKGIYASDFNPVRMSICEDCKDSITKKLVNKGTLGSETIAAGMI